MPAKVRDNVSLSSLTFAFAAALSLLAPFVVFLTANNYALLAVEVLPFYLAALVAGLLIVASARFKPTVVARLALSVCVFISITFLYDADTIPRVTAIAVVIGAAMWILREHFAKIILVATAAHLGSTIGLNFFDHATTVQPDSFQSTSLDGDADLPPVLHLVLDEFAGLRGLPGEISGSQELVSRISNYYTGNGFRLSSHAYSQYLGTGDSLSNLLNFSSSDKSEAYIHTLNEKMILSVNKYFEFLSDTGYALHIFQSDYLNFCDTPGVHVASCSTYQSNSIGTIADIEISSLQKSRFILNSYVDSSAFLRRLRRAYARVDDRLDIALPAWPAGNSRTGPLAAMATIANLKTELGELSPGDFYFAHLLLPHFPYNLNSDCSPKSRVRTWLNRIPFENVSRLGEQNNTASRAVRYQHYFAQIKCTQTVIEEFIAAIKASGQWQRSIIIIHGDHGSRIVRHHPLVENLNLLVKDDFRDAYSSFFAVKSGSSTGGLDVVPLPLQTLLAREWQLQAPQVEPHDVYLEKYGQTGLQATPLRGFSPMPDTQEHGSRP